MFETLSILTFIYVAIVLAYIRKLIIRMQQDNMRQIEDLQKIYAKLVDQQNQLAEHKIDIQNEASKVFTLYDMTREVTRTRSQQDAFEIFKDKLHQNVYYVKCELSDAPCPEVTNFMGKNGRFFFRLRNKETEMGHIMIDRLETEDKDKAVILCHQFALALRRVKLYQEIEQTAITDSLTGLHTRRYALERLDEELTRAKSRRMDMAVLMIDIDHFKNCNDRYGHLVGDQILREVGDIIRSSTREIDIAGRYGGEEFCIVLPDTDLSGARYAAERIRSAAEERTITAYDATVHITVSVGIATYPADARKSSELIDKADWTLYKAKKQGRNRVCAFGD